MSKETFEWLLDSDYVPAKVTHFTNRTEMTPEQFDESQAQSYGYESFESMVAHNFERDQAHFLKYGDKVKELI